MKSLRNTFASIITVTVGLCRIVLNALNEHPWIATSFKTSLAVFSVLLAIVSAITWHISATWQEQLLTMSSASSYQIAAITAGATILNTKAAMLSVAAALLNGFYYWLGAVKE